MASEWLNFRGTVPAQIQEWLIADTSCSLRLNVSAWPQKQLWKSRCFFIYLKDSEDKQPDLVSSLNWKVHAVVVPRRESRTFAAWKMLFLNPTDMSWLENIRTLAWDCVLAEINTLEIETKKNLLMCMAEELFINEWNFKAYSRYCCLPSKDKKKSCYKDLSHKIVPRNPKQREENKLISACFMQTYNKE